MLVRQKLMATSEFREGPLLEMVPTQIRHQLPSERMLEAVALLNLLTIRNAKGVPVPKVLEVKRYLTPHKQGTWSTGHLNCRES